MMLIEVLESELHTMANTLLGKAKKEKNDEFYTQLSDIEAEMRHYKDLFRGKVIFCNCDDPYESNFFKYFAMNFNYLGLKKLIATCYTSSPVAGKQLTLFDIMGLEEKPDDSKRAYKIVITEVTDANADGAIDLSDVEYLLKNKKNVLTLLQGDGDFRSAECIELLKQADIVVTNPPFSLFREYVAQLVEYNKEFIIIGNQNAIHYKEVFPLIQNNKIWLGYNSPAPKEFRLPTLLEDRKNIYRRDTGELYAKFGNTKWFTNIDIKKRHEDLVLFRNYTAEAYPKYINFNAIDVSKTADIPCDYWGDMGVPDNFLEQYNPEQFQIVGLAESELGRKIGFSANLTEEQCKALFREYKSFRRGNPVYRKANGALQKPYSRIIIRRKAANK